MKANWLFKGLIGLIMLLSVSCGEQPPTIIQVTRLVTRTVVVTRVIGPERSCTLLGCHDGVTIGLIGARPEMFSIDIVYEKDGESVQITRQCENGRWLINDQLCSEIQLETTPELITITANWGENSITKDYTPFYEPFRPNGEACEPVCQVAIITFAFPE